MAWPTSEELKLRRTVRTADSISIKENQVFLLLKTGNLFKMDFQPFRADELVSVIGVTSQNENEKPLEDLKSSLIFNIHIYKKKEVRKMKVS